MNHTIRVAYNWIGPNGPVSNTEVPNLLNLSDVAHGLKTDTKYFHFGERSAQLFRRSEHFRICGTFEIIHNATDKSPFIYPLQLDYRLHFNPYFVHDHGILEWGHVHKDIINRVKLGLGYFMLELSHETFVSDHYLNQIESYFTHYGISLDRIIYVTGCINAEEIMQQRIQKNGASIHLVTFPIAWLGTYYRSKSHISENKITSQSTENKLFLSFNRRFKYHRHALALCLDKHNLTEKCWVSMPALEPGQKILSFDDYARLIQPKLTELEITPEDCSAFASKLPLEIDSVTDNFVMMGLADRVWYDTSLISLVTETNYEETLISLTEKTFKTFLLRHPFIMVGVPGTIRALHSFGFKTWGQWWDESYDEEVNNTKRLSKIVDVCVGISKWSAEQIEAFRSDVKSVLDHNYNLIHTTPHELLQSKIKTILGRNA